jgi:hypothetical protein
MNEVLNYVVSFAELGEFIVRLEGEQKCLYTRKWEKKVMAYFKALYRVNRPRFEWVSSKIKGKLLLLHQSRYIL